jgi:phosphotransferase system IIB component
MIYINNVWLYPAIIILSLVILVLIIFLMMKSKKKKKITPPKLDYESLLQSLGGAVNITDVSMEHQRLKVKLMDLKKVDQSLLKQLEIPAFLKGKELTLLIKHHTKEVLSYLGERRKEVN